MGDAQIGNTSVWTQLESPEISIRAPETGLAAGNNLIGAGSQDSAADVTGPGESDRQKLKLRAPQMSLGDLANGTTQDATDFATGIGGGHMGCHGFRHANCRLWHDYATTGGNPRGFAERPLSRTMNPICLVENFWVME
jgi:hypothetical protein